MGRASAKLIACAALLPTRVRLLPADRGVHTRIHVGSPILGGPYATRRDDVFEYIKKEWGERNVAMAHL